MALPGEAQEARVHALRLRPGQDVKLAIQEYARTHNLQAGYVVTAVGSVRGLRLRLANRQEATTFEGFHEVVSLVGTFSAEGCHLHLSASDCDGTTRGGHLVEGNLVYTTLELVLGEVQGVRFRRQHDPETGWPELHIEKTSGPGSESL